MKGSRILSAEQKANELVEIFENIGMSSELATICAYTTTNEILRTINTESSKEEIIKFLYFADVVQIIRSRMKD